MKFLATIFLPAILCLTSVQTEPGLLAAESQFQEEFTREIPLESGGHLSLNNVIGEIEVSGWDTNLVQIQAVKKVRKVSDRAQARKWLDNIEIKIKKSGNRVEIKTVFSMDIELDADDSWFTVLYKLSKLTESCDGDRLPFGVSYRIKLPRNTDVSLNTSIGEIEVCDLDGNLEVKSVIGSLELLRVSGDLRADLSIGEITLKEVRGSISAETGAGEIEAAIDQVEEGKDIDLSTFLGEINLGLSPALAADLDLSVGFGTLDLEFPKSDIEGKVYKRKIKGKINGGGPRIRARSSLGEVKITKLR